MKIVKEKKLLVKKIKVAKKIKAKTKPKLKGKISKIMLWPSRKINLGNYSTADLNAGVEIVFDKPIDLDSKELQETLDKARNLIKEEFKKQYEPYRVYLKSNKKKGN